MGYIDTEIDSMLLFLEEKEKIYDRIVKLSPSGTLQCTKRGGRNNYYHVTLRPQKAGSDSVSDRYQKRGITKDADMIRSLASKEFAICSLKRIRRCIHILRRARAGLIDISPAAVFDSMKTAYQTLPQEWYEELGLEEKMAAYDRWARTPFQQSAYKPEERNKMTSYGWSVRTKAEQLVVEKLFERSIRPRYEQVIIIDGYELAPDFTFPDKFGREFYWEYCGMMDDPDYVSRQIWKRKMYESIGITAWDNMIYTFHRNNEMNAIEIAHIIEDQILPRMF